MGWESDQILPVTIWSKGRISHRISCVAISPDNKYIITGSWDGNIFIWSWDLKNESLNPSWLVSASGCSVTAIACFNKFFVTAHQDGIMYHFELPTGRLLFSRDDSSLIHNQTILLSDNEVLCAGYYPDLVIIDTFSLKIITYLQSRVQSDWVSCLKILNRDDGIHVQGLTFSGVLKTWALREIENGVALESSSGPIGVKQCKAMAFDMSRKYLLLVTSSEVFIFDAGITIVFQHKTNFALEGGDFFQNKILFWTKTGDIYECDIEKKSVVKILDACGLESHVPQNSLIQMDSNYYHIAGDITGRLTISRFATLPGKNVQVIVSANASDISRTRNGLLEHFSVTCSVHIFNMNKFIAGCSDGSLILFSASELLHSFFFLNDIPDYKFLIGHDKAVKCLLYPYLEQPNYPESLVVSGSEDHSVCLWDISKRELLSRFSIHSGPVVKLMTPPKECHSRIASTICSVGSDHSVAILSLRERRCVFFASQHPFPIVGVHWKPYHDFLLVKCFDGSVFVWELRTGILDRVLSGISAEEVIYDCVESNDDALFDFYTKGPILDDIGQKPLVLTKVDNGGPVQIRGILSSLGIESHVLIINVSQLSYYLESIFPDNSPIVNLDFQDLSKSPDSAGIQKKISNVLDAIKQEAESLQEMFHVSPAAATRSPNVTPQRKASVACGTQLIPMAQLAVSLLHTWTFQDEVDCVCIEKLGLLQPQTSFSFDHSSFQNALSVNLNFDCPRTKFEASALQSLVMVLRGFSFSASSLNVESAAWKTILEFNMSVYKSSSPITIDKLAALWQTSSKAVRDSVRDLLPTLLLELNAKDRLVVLYKWRKFLPTAGFLLNNATLAGTAIVLFGLMASDVKVKAEKFDNIRETADSLRILLSSKKSSSSLKEIAMDILGRGYLIWEPVFPVDEVMITIFDVCSGPCDSRLLETTRRTLQIITRTRLDKTLAFLKFMCKTAHPALDKSKSEIIRVIHGLLLEFPNELNSLLNDSVEVLLACIDSGHLRSRELFSLIPGIKNLDQLHHSLAAQRIAIGMPDGKVVVNDLRAHRSHVFPAHDESIAIVRFSPDGRLLLTLSSCGNASLWQPSHGFFDIGLGQFKFRIMKSINNVVDSQVVAAGVSVDWNDNRSVTIRPVPFVDSSSDITLTF